MECQNDVRKGSGTIYRDVHKQRSAEGGFQEDLQHTGLCKASNGNGRITEVEEVTNLIASALAELIRPAIEKAYQIKQQKSGSLGLIINPDFRSMEPKKLLEEFLRLVREEQQA